jgi:hypothetical protein
MIFYYQAIIFSVHWFVTNSVTALNSRVGMDRVKKSLSHVLLFRILPMFRDNFALKYFLSQRFLFLVLLGGLCVSGVTQASALSPLPPQSPPAPELSQTIPRPSRQIVRRVRRDLSDRFNISRQSLRMIAFSRETWSNSCLGLEAPNERCAGVLVEGWRIEMTDGQQNWMYRTDLTAEVLRPERPVVEAQLPADVSAKVLSTIAKQVRVPVSSLRITESREATWDGCMGIYEPNRACTQIAIAGWRLIVTDEKQNWVYHISEDGARIAQNGTASGGSLLPVFSPDEESPFGQPDVVFRSIQSGGLAGIVTERVLMADGTLYRRTSDRLQSADPVVEKRLSKRQVQQFQTLLETQRLPNLNNLRYWSDAALADYPTMTIQGLGSSVEYVDLEMERLPVALRSVVEAWNRL